MLTQERYQTILQILSEKNTVTVQELTKLLNTSESTIRRDLTTLDEMGKLNKVFGGATSIHQLSGVYEADVKSREGIMLDEKKAIAIYCAKLINDTDFVYIDAGTTTDILTDYITNKNATYVTNGITHAKNLIRKGLTTYTIGGRIKPATEAIMGAEGWKVLKRLNTKALKSEDAREVLKSVMESGSVDQNLQIEGDTLIKYLGADAFVEVPDGIQIIADSAFEYCMEVQEVHLPDSVERIGKHAFQGSGIKKIHLPESIKTIDIYAFSGTPLEYIELPENLQKLGHSAFRYCRMLKKAKFPEHLVEIPHDTFNDCGKLREVILPHDTEVIGAHAFSGCAALEQVDLPESVKRIEEGAFVTCVSLEKVHLPKGLEVVERKVFYRCTNLKELHFPKRVTEFGKGIFSQCSALKRVYIEGNPVDEEVFQDWDMWTTCYDMEEIIAPNMRITRFAKEWRMWAAAGLADYLVEQGDVRSEILDSYVKDLKENRSSYEVLLLENKKLLQFFIHYNLLAEQAVNRLLDQSLQKSDMEIRSMLLNYQDEIQNEDKKEETGSQLDQLLAALS